MQHDDFLVLRRRDPSTRHVVQCQLLRCHHRLLRPSVRARRIFLHVDAGRRGSGAFSPIPFSFSPSGRKCFPSSSLTCPHHVALRPARSRNDYRLRRYSPIARSTCRSVHLRCCLRSDGRLQVRRLLRRRNDAVGVGGDGTRCVIFLSRKRVRGRATSSSGADRSLALFFPPQLASYEHLHSSRVSRSLIDDLQRPYVVRPRSNKRLLSLSLLTFVSEEDLSLLSSQFDVSPTAGKGQGRKERESAFDERKKGQAPERREKKVNLLKERGKEEQG
jgi:hypothetical protein